MNPWYIIYLIELREKMYPRRKKEIKVIPKKMKTFRLAKIEKILFVSNEAIENLEKKEVTLNRNVSDQWKKIMHTNEVNALKAQAYDKIDKLLMDEG